MGLVRRHWNRGGRRVDSPNWHYVRTIDGRKVWVSTGTSDRAEAEKFVAQLELRRVDGPSLQDLVETYLGELSRKGRTQAHVDQTRKRLTVLLGSASSLVDITPQAIREALGSLGQDGSSPSTVNGYRTTLHGFLEFLRLDGKIPNNPVESVGTVRRVEPVHQRRALTQEELDRLIASVPQDRGAVYCVAALTGLRRNELTLLECRDVNLMDRTLRVRAANAKNRREAVLPLAAPLVDTLRPFLQDKEPTERVFQSMPAIPRFYKDLKLAGIEKDTAEGRLLFHGLRITFATALARAGVSLQVAQRLMRHSDPKLTANVYTRVGIDTEREALSMALSALSGTRQQTPNSCTDSEKLVWSSTIDRACVPAPS